MKIIQVYANNDEEIKRLYEAIEATVELHKTQ